MALVPKVNLCISSKCDTIDIYEETSPYIAATNAGGWGAPNIDTSAITDAKIEIYDSAGNNLQDTIVMYDGSTDVYSGVAGAPTPGAFLAINDYTWNLPDGIWEVRYIITDSGAKVSQNALQHVLFICNINNCLSGLKAKAVVECDANTLDKIKEKINQLELIIYGIKSAFSCGDFTSAEANIEIASTICDNLCDCGCGDC